MVSECFFLLPPALITQDPSSGSLLEVIYSTSHCYFSGLFFFPSQHSALSKSLGVFPPPPSNHHMLPHALGTFFFKRLACNENIQLKKVNSIGWDRVSSGVTPTPAREYQSSFGSYPLGHLEASRLTPGTVGSFPPPALVLESKQACLVFLDDS